MPESALPETLVGDSDVFRRLMERMHRYAAHPILPVILEGETGTGKTVLARHLHRLSPRAHRPFQRIELGTRDDGIAASELLGHRRGAFTGAISDTSGPFVAANGGTVLLDEFENTTPTEQRLLLQVTETGEVRPVKAVRSVHVDVWMLVATNVPVGQLVAEKLLRQDLAARLAGCIIRVPPLREHAHDIPLLVDHFVSRLMGSAGYRAPPELEPDLMQALVHFDWPWNVRQLSHVLQRLLLEATPHATIGLEHCIEDLEFLRSVDASGPWPSHAAARRAVDRYDNREDAARSLRVSRTTLWRRLKESGDDEHPAT